MHWIGKLRKCPPRCLPSHAQNGADIDPALLVLPPAPAPVPSPPALVQAPVAGAPQAAPEEGGGSSFPTGAIIGAAVGGAALCLAAAALAYYKWWRPSRRVPVVAVGVPPLPPGADAADGSKRYPPANLTVQVRA